MDVPEGWNWTAQKDQSGRCKSLKISFFKLFIKKMDGPKVWKWTVFKCQSGWPKILKNQRRWLWSMKVDGQKKTKAFTYIPLDRPVSSLWTIQVHPVRPSTFMSHEAVSSREAVKFHPFRSLSLCPVQFQSFRLFSFRLSSFTLTPGKSDEKI